MAHGSRAYITGSPQRLSVVTVRIEAELRRANKNTQGAAGGRSCASPIRKAVTEGPSRAPQFGSFVNKVNEIRKSPAYP